MVEYIANTRNDIRQVKDVVYAIEQCIDPAGNSKVQDVQILLEVNDRFTVAVVQVFLFPPPEIVDHNDVVTEPGQSPGEPGADHACSASDKNSCHGFLRFACNLFNRYFS